MGQPADPQRVVTATLLVPVALAAAVCALPVRRPVAERLRCLRPTPLARRSSRRMTGVALSFVAALGLAVGLVAGIPGWLLGSAAVLAGLGAIRRRARDGSREYADVPLVADLLAAGLAAGVTLPDALRAAGVAAGPALVWRVADVVDALSSGEPPEQAWAGWMTHPHLAPVARICVRTSGSGAAAAAELTRIAARLRARRRAAADQRVAQASVWVVMPLGLCFLPAFVLVGVVPLALGLVGQLH
jgi:Flp pilus assembly protein TadB